jgi:hypothetical protein
MFSSILNFAQMMPLWILFFFLSNYFLIVACFVTLFVVGLSCYCLYGAVFIHIVRLNSIDAIFLFFLRLTTLMKCNQGVAFCVACNGIVALLRCMQHVFVVSMIILFEDSAPEMICIQLCL